MQDHLLFLSNIVLDWLALLSGVASAAFALITWRLKGRTEKIATACFSVLCFVMAADMAWRDEHRNVVQLIAEKQLAVGSANTCSAAQSRQEAYAKGLERSAQAQQQILNKMVADAGKQQGTINTCVVSLGKANPTIIRDIFAYAIPIWRESKKLPGVGRFQPVAVVQHGIAVITTNQNLPPRGRLRCEKPFEPTKPAIPMHAAGVVASVSSDPVVAKISDNEWDIEVRNTGTPWGPNTPINLLYSSSQEDIGDCSFTLR